MDEAASADDGKGVDNDVPSGEDESNMPWSGFNPYFKYLRETEKGNFLALCKLCTPGPKAEKSCSSSSNSNLKLHLKRVHKWTEEKLNTLKVTTPTQGKGLKRKASADAQAAPTEGQASDFFKRRVTQKDVDNAVLNLVINERLPYRIVDSPHFRHAVLLGCPENLTVCCRQTFSERMKDHHNEMVENIRKELAKVPYVCTTADAWSKHRRGFLGMTCTWLNPKTIQREIVGLAVRRLRGRHTHKRLALAIKACHEKFHLNPAKIRKTITDSGANFVKAFKVYSKDSAENDDEAEEADADDEASDAESSEDDIVPLDIEAALMNADADWDTEADLDIELPSHQRCAVHILNRLGAEDSKNALDTNASYKKVHDQTDEKLRACWRRQNQSTLVAEAIQAGLGVKLQIPGDTRWNSEYDAKAQIVKIHDGVNGEETFAKTMESAGLSKLTAAELKYLKEFVWVMEPVAIALDILQKVKNLYMGYLLPTIRSLETQLRLRREKDGKPLKYCNTLVTTLLGAIQGPRRFAPYFEDRDLHIAASLIPRFKLDWISDLNLRADCKAQILREINTLLPNEDWCTVAAQTAREPSKAATAAPADADTVSEEEDDPDPERACGGGVGSSGVPGPGVSELSFEDSFYGVTAPVPVAEEAGVESAESELNRFLVAPRTLTVEDCYAVRPCGTRKFPRLAQLFVKYNVALPSSASVERLFWVAGVSFADLRNILGDNNLENEVLLRVNKKFWEK